MDEYIMRIMLNYDEYCRLLELKPLDAIESTQNYCIFDNNNIVDSACKNKTMLGEMNVRKTVLEHSNDIIVELSENTYLGTTDYELEIEYDPEVMRSAECLLNYYAEYIDLSLYGEYAIVFLERLKYAKTREQRFIERLSKTNLIDD